MCLNALEWERIGANSVVVDCRSEASCTKNNYLGKTFTWVVFFILHQTKPPIG